MVSHLSDSAVASATPISLISPADFKGWRARQPKTLQVWLDDANFKPAAGKWLRLPPQGKGRAGLLFVADRPLGPWAIAELPRALGKGTYRLDADLTLAEATNAAAAWGLGHYRFRRYKKSEESTAVLLWPKGADRAQAQRLITAVTLVRDLINTPAEDMGPAELAAAAGAVAKRYKARMKVTSGPALAKSFPTIHTVGRAATRGPRLIDLQWGPANAPRVTLVGKGVCFDSGGLNLKAAGGMRWMKKDMGGAATVLGLAQMIMDAKLKLRLRVLIPAVENAVAGNAFRPGDVIRTRKGLTVEIGNTDAEGRLILCDALAFGDEEAPELMVDCATLTGAARVALGPDLPVLFTDDDRLAADLEAQGRAVEDPLWRLPLHAPYRRMIDSNIADINNAGEGGHAGAITAALFLKEFVARAKAWAHIDLYAWNDRDRPGRPQGGEALAMRALFALLVARYGK